MKLGEHIRVNGTVQGVGFRPTVWRLARDNGLTGRVWNDAEGVVIEVWGTPVALERFAVQILAEQPPLARIEEIVRSDLDPAVSVPDQFEIFASASGMVRTAVAPDAATCPECLAEVLNPDDRRYRYPFTNCTHCGPRLSIIKAIPYDRKNTSMAEFPLCEQCLEEYQNPADRRFHAQPNACGECGPEVWLEDAQGNRVLTSEQESAIEYAAQLIHQGYIVAIKGLGGVHLCCDAGNAEVVHRLRQRKQRYQKALALMATDIAMVKRYARVTETEERLLQHRAAPIVVLDTEGEALADELAPGQASLGFMLPYTPLHHLLMLEMSRPVVMTSGNLSEEPQTIANTDTRERLANIADFFLLHNREIVNRLDDSVQRVMDGVARFLRRARGYAPIPFQLGDSFSSCAKVLAMGGELKNTFCMLKEGRAIMSQHIGDLEEIRTQNDYRYNLELYQQIFDHTPEIVAIDSHADYLSSQLGQALAEKHGVSIIKIQHHHAHIVSCMVEHGLSMDNPGVLGVALDGLGMGDDGNLWGGEFLCVSYHDYTRLAHFQNVAMLGAAKAMHEPWRNSFAHLHAAFNWKQVAERYSGLDIIQFLKTKPVATLQAMADRGINSPISSSCGRLFDAVAAAIGICRDQAWHEGQAAIELESLATKHFVEQSGRGYPSSYQEGEPGILSWGPLWVGILDDIEQGVMPAVIAARFHHGLAQAVAGTAQSLCRLYGLHEVVLSGGVFQNRLLLERVSGLLSTAGLTIYAPIKFPANDGGLSLGQAAIAAAKQIKPETTG